MTDDQKTVRESAIRITLRTLEIDFGVDISPAADLHGQELQAWCEAAEDAVFNAQMTELKKPVEPAPAEKYFPIPRHFLKKREPLTPEQQAEIYADTEVPARFRTNETTQAFTKMMLDGTMNRLMSKGVEESIAADEAARKKQTG